MRKLHGKKFIVRTLFSAVLLCALWDLQAAGAADIQARPDAAGTGQGREPEDDGVRQLYDDYYRNFESVEYRADIEACGFRIIEEQIFPVRMRQYGDVSVIPAFDMEYNRLALFFSLQDGTVVYKTEQLETNNRSRGEMRQSTREISAISLQDVDGDARMDIVLLTVCGDGEEACRVGDVLYQNVWGTGFYRDYRISDKINRFGMNKSIDLITAFARDGDSTEFLYTAATLDELLENGFQIIEEQHYPRNFEKLGRLQVVPGTYHIANNDVFMVYLVNEDGYIAAGLQPMGNYDSLYALKGISCRDIDGDGLKDIVVLARYSYEGIGAGDGSGTGQSGGHQLIVRSDYSVYYQRTGGFSEDEQMRDWYPCSAEETMEGLVEKAREFWGWKSEQ